MSIDRYFTQYWTGPICRYNQYQTSQEIPNLKKMFLVYTRCVFSGSELNVPVLCLAYPCHNLFLFGGMPVLPAGK